MTTTESEEGGMHPCINCGKYFFVPEWEEEMAEPKLCSEQCAKEWSS